MKTRKLGSLISSAQTEPAVQRQAVAPELAREGLLTSRALVLRLVRELVGRGR
jgi:hypothetical protein